MRKEDTNLVARVSREMKARVDKRAADLGIPVSELIRRSLSATLGAEDLEPFFIYHEKGANIEIPLRTFRSGKIDFRPARK